MALRSGADKALALIRTLPRIALGNLKGREERRPKTLGRGQHGGKLHGYPHKGGMQRMNFGKLGYEGARRTPFYLRIPVEHYYKDHSLRRQYPHLSLLKLQSLIDTNRLNPNDPIDIVALSNTKVCIFDPFKRHFGFNLTDEGLDQFSAKVNIEVQWTTEAVIAAVEKNGGTITTAYYDMDSLITARDPIQFFSKGVPIPKRMLPPEDAVEYYSDPKFRGYLADPDLIAEERLILAQKYGYILPDLATDPQRELLLERKDPRQIFYGLSPGWVVNLRDKCILKPKDKFIDDYYKDTLSSSI